jgi:uncharacterized protein YciI
MTFIFFPVHQPVPAQKIIHVIRFHTVAEQFIKKMQQLKIPAAAFFSKRLKEISSPAVTRHASPVTRHPSRVTRHPSRVTRHPSHNIRPFPLPLPKTQSMFAIHSVYLKPLEEVDRHLAAHRAFLKNLYEQGITICSGPQVPRTGGFILLNAPGKPEALEIMKNDPYVIHGVAEYSIIEFEVRSFAQGFSEFVQKDQ